MLEITERTDARKELLLPEAARLRRLGFKLALDDVGAGNAGLEMLSALPVDFIKIDRAVVANAVEDRGARAVMLGIMAFARESGAFVIAEGIETEAMLELARDPDPEREARPVGAHGAQGFLLGRPAPVPSEVPSYHETMATLTELTADRERRRIAAALQQRRRALPRAAAHGAGHGRRAVRPRPALPGRSTAASARSSAGARCWWARR